MNETMEVHTKETNDDAIRTGVRAGDDTPIFGSGGATPGGGVLGSGNAAGTGMFGSGG
jgi:hypothetical protein